MSISTMLRVAGIHREALKESTSISEIWSYLSRAYPWTGPERKETVFIMIDAPVDLDVSPFAE